MPFRRSPFPGMDPYIEVRWANAHAVLIASAADALAPQLADDLTADVEGLARTNHHEGDGRLDPGPAVHRCVRILDAAGDRIVTAIEFLSPWNKRPSGGRREYMRKRRAVLASDANLVEVDLVRGGGNWTPMVRPFEVPLAARTPYRVTVARADPPGGPLGLYAIRLADRLPTIRVPLRPGEPDVTLDLQLLVDDVYRTGRYDRSDYTRDCDPPLAGDDAAWGDRLLRAASRRA